jgi:streptogramin lyase
MERRLLVVALAHAFVMACGGGSGGGPPFEIPDGDFGDFGTNDDTATHVDGGGGDSGETPTFEQFPVGPQLTDLAVDRSGNLWATTEIGAAPGSAKVYRFTPSTKKLDAFDVSGSSKAIETQGGLAIDASGNVWVMTFGETTRRDDPSNALVQLSPSGSVLKRITNTAGSPDPCPDNPCAQNPIYSQSSSPAIDPSGNVWITDPSNVSKTFFVAMSPSGSFLRYGTLSSAAHAPTVSSVAIDGAGNLWGSDPNENLIVKIAPDGSIAGKFPLSDKKDGAIVRFAFDRSGNVWVAGSEEAFTPGELMVMSSDGVVKKKIPIPSGGSADAIAIDAAGLVWVIDGGMQNVYAFDGSGAVVRQFPFPNVIGLGVSPSIQRSFVIDPSGNLWWTTGQPGLGPELQGQLIRVAGVATGPQYFPYSGAQYPY